MTGRVGRGGGGGIISDSPSVTARPAKRRKIRAIRLPNGILKALNSGLSVSGTISGLIFRTRSGKTHLYAIKSSEIRNAHAKAVITVVMFTLSALIMPTSAIITLHAKQTVHQSDSRNASGSSIRFTQDRRFINQDHTKMAVHQSGSYKDGGSSIRFTQGQWFVNQDHTKMVVHQSGSYKDGGSSIRFTQGQWFVNQDHTKMVVHQSGSRKADNQDEAGARIRSRWLAIELQSRGSAMIRQKSSQKEVIKYG